jgi:hypothetical protein
LYVPEEDGLLPWLDLNDAVRPMEADLTPVQPELLAKVRAFRQFNLGAGAKFARREPEPDGSWRPPSPIFVFA